MNICLKCMKPLKGFTTGDLAGICPVIVGYCENERCERFGLLTALSGMAAQPEEPPANGTTITRGPICQQL